MISDWVQEMTKSHGERVCVEGGGGLRCKFSFVKFLPLSHSAPTLQFNGGCQLYILRKAVIIMVPERVQHCQGA